MALFACINLIILCGHQMSAAPLSPFTLRMQPKGVNRLRAFGKYSPRRKRTDLYGRGSVDSVSKAKLTIGDIFPPRPQRTVGLDGD